MGTMVTGDTSAVDKGTSDPIAIGDEDARFGPPDPKQLYPTAYALHPAYKERDDDLAIGLGLTAAERTAKYVQHTQLIDGAGLEPYGIGRTLFHLGVDADLAKTRGETPPSDADVQRWREESRAHIASLYGEQAEQLLARAQKFVAHTPGLGEVMHRGHAGDRRDVVAAIVKHVQQVDFR